MRVSWLVLLSPILSTVLSASSALAQVHGLDMPLPFGITDSGTATALVARVGPISITAQQFLLNYELGPAFPKRHKDSKEDYLGYMINEKLLALDGYSRGLQWSERVRTSRAEIEGDLATEELYRDDVLSKVRVTGRELAAAVRDEHVHRTLHWIYAATREGILDAETELHAGVSFDTLFRRQMTGSVTADQRSMETTLFSLRNKTPSLAVVVDTLPPHAASAPIKGPDGWYILYVVDGWRDMLSTDAEDAKLLSDARQSIVQRRSDSLSDRYVRGIMLGENPVIIRRTFDLLRAWLGIARLSTETYAAWGLTKRFEDEHDPVDPSRIDRYAQDTLVTLRSRPVLLGDYLRWYRDREFVVRFAITSPQAFFLSIEETVWHMVRDRLLVRRALERNLQKREKVQSQLKWWEEKILYAEVKSRIADSIALDDTALAAYYRDHERDFRDEKGNVRPFAEARPDVRKGLYTAELTKRLLHRIIALKKMYPVEVRNETLRSLPVDTENNPKAIDVYLVKKGGVFPHPAFPTIDPDWESWE